MNALLGSKHTPEQDLGAALPLENPGLIQQIYSAGHKTLDILGNTAEIIKRNFTLGLAFGALAVSGAVAKTTESEAAAADNPDAQTASGRYLYYDKRNDFRGTVPTAYIRQCLKQNTGAKGQNIRSPWQFPYGSIEKQSVKARIGSNTLKVDTTLRDVNLDWTEVSYTGNTSSEFLYDCSYVTDSHTTIELFKKNGSKSNLRPIGKGTSVKYHETPAVFHKKQFVTRKTANIFKLPARLTHTDLKKGKYCLRVTQYSESIAKPWDGSLTKPGEDIVLLQPNYDRGMLNKGQANPAPMSRTWEKCITKAIQATFPAPKKSPWSMPVKH